MTDRSKMSVDRPASIADETSGDWLDTMLVAAGQEHRADYLADDGFTAKVVAGLPAPATPPAWRRPALAILWAVAGIGGAFALPGAFADVAREFFRVVGGHPVSVAEIGVAVAVVGAATWSAAAWLLRSD
jgi:hypothetical protein